MMAELPLVVVDVQRGGPSTGLPTKTEQADFNIAMFGRNSESPAIVLASSTPSDCFHYAYQSIKLAVEHGFEGCIDFLEPEGGALVGQWFYREGAEALGKEEGWPGSSWWEFFSPNARIRCALSLSNIFWICDCNFVNNPAHNHHNILT